MANAGMVGLDWQQRINWDRLRKYRLERARARMKAAGLGAMLLMYDENVRYVTSTLTPGWNRLKPGLRYAMLCGDDAPVLFRSEWQTQGWWDLTGSSASTGTGCANTAWSARARE